MSKSKDAAKEKESLWPFLILYAWMWAGMIGTTLNRDPIKFEFSIAIVFGCVAIVGIVAYLAYGRLRGHSIFPNFYRNFIGNLALHIFTLTGVIFLGYLFFVALVQIMIIAFQAPIFEPSCAIPSQRDVALYIWDAMARGAFKFLARYLDIAHDGCIPNKNSWTAWITSLFLTAFTSLVLVWYAISFAKAYYRRLRSG
ncbi:MAG: hypothetical protein ACRD3J_17950 [Thermoanaerobaculia bacterium]